LLSVDAAVREGSKQSDKSWVYLQRFCFDDTGTSVARWAIRWLWKHTRCHALQRAQQRRRVGA
jgi:hypothetical protein